MNAQPALQSVALVVHCATLSQHENTMSVVAHDVHYNDQKSAPMLGPGRVFSTRDKQELSSLLSGHMNASLELLQPVCLAASHETLMWFRPRQKTLVNIDGKEMTAPLPSLIFLVHRRRLFVVAYKGENRPDATTRILQSGLPNCSGSDGSWCSGGNSLPEHPKQMDIESIEHKFFLSPFTHWNGAGPKNAGEMGSWFETLSTKRAFPVSKLKPITKNYSNDCMTLNRWFAENTRG